MSRLRRRVRGLSRLILSSVAPVFFVPLLWAGEQLIKSTPQNYSDVPVLARSATTVLVERRVSTPDPSSTASRPAPSRALVSAEHSDQTASRFVAATPAASKTTTSEHVLKGDVRYWNRSSKTVELLGLLVAPFDSDHNSLTPGRLNVVRIAKQITGGHEQTIPWELRTPVVNIEEIVVAVLSVKFSDGTMWEAPNVEMVDFF